MPHIRSSSRITKSGLTRLGGTEPGGYLQWVERDWLSKFPKTASETDNPHTQLTAYMNQHFNETELVLTSSLCPDVKNTATLFLIPWPHDLVNPPASSRPTPYFLLLFYSDFRRWITCLPKHFKSAGLEVLEHIHESPLPIYRKPWNEDNLIGNEAFSNSIADPEKQAWFKDMHARCATEAAKGWYVDWELHIVVGRKAVDA